MANTGRIPLWLVGLVGGLAVITMLSLFIYKPLVKSSNSCLALKRSFTNGIC
jgi:uncharacterized membrane-anchored protein